MLREIFKYAKKLYDNKPVESVQMLLDKEKIKLSKTKPYMVTDDFEYYKSHDNFQRKANTMTWNYKFRFDNMSRKRQFLNAVKKYPPQPWDEQIRWMDEHTTLKDEKGNFEFIVEVQCFVPQEEVGRFMAVFEAFVSKKLILDDSEEE